MTEQHEEIQKDFLQAMQEFCDRLELKGGGTWAPVRAADFDVAGHGVWEAWEYCKIGELPSGSVGAIPTGDWVAHNFATGHHFGFRSRHAAEMMAVLQNENAPTRVVSADGSVELSVMSFDEISERVNSRIELDAVAAE